MKTLASLCLFAVLGTVAWAQPYSLDWFAVDAGGGINSGGQYVLAGTIGQPDAGTITGGNYAIAGGFWAVAAAVPSSPLPILTIVRSGSNALISWHSPSTGFVLQESSSLSAPSWVNSPQIPVDNGNTRTVLVYASPDSKYYRLKK